MKKTLPISFLLLVALLPLSASAFTVNVNSITDPNWYPLNINAYVTAVSSSASAAANAISAATDLYQTYELNGMLSNAGKFAPYFNMTHASILAKQEEHMQQMIAQQERSRESVEKDAVIVNLSPKEIWARIKAFSAGDMFKTLESELQKRFNDLQERLIDTFSEQMIDTIMSNLIYDILSCQTPQLDTLLPSSNIDIGLPLCDYRQMFNNMKDQVQALSDKGFMGSFKINGKDVSTILKDPGALSDAIKFQAPGVGHKLVADLLSDQAINLSVKGVADAKQIAQEMGVEVKAKKMKNLFGPRKAIDVMEEQTKQAAQKAAQDAAVAEAQLGISAAQVQQQTDEITRSVTKEIHENSQKSLNQDYIILSTSNDEFL